MWDLVLACAVLNFSFCLQFVNIYLTRWWPLFWRSLAFTPFPLRGWKDRHCGCHLCGSAMISILAFFIGIRLGTFAYDVFVSRCSLWLSADDGTDWLCISCCTGPFAYVADCNARKQVDLPLLIVFRWSLGLTPLLGWTLARICCGCWNVTVTCLEKEALTIRGFNLFQGISETPKIASTAFF